MITSKNKAIAGLHVSQKGGTTQQKQYAGPHGKSAIVVSTRPGSHIGFRRATNVVHDTPTNGGASLYQVASIYLEWL